MNRHLQAEKKHKGISAALAGLLQSKYINENEPETVPPIVYDVLSSPGQPLDTESRTFFEPRFGHDFSLVRVHTDAKAAESAQAVHASAYTVGRDICFARGRYAPATTDGRRLLLHELSHVVQQRFADAPRSLSFLAAGEPEAHVAAGKIHGVVPVTLLTSTAVGLAREEEEPERKGPFGPTVFVSGEQHDHAPTGKWADVQKDSSLIGMDDSQRACALMSPESVMKTALKWEMRGKPLARKHLQHFLSGSGADLPVDLEDVLKRDVFVRAVLAAEMKSSPVRGFVKIEQNHYDVEDFQYAFGAIDRLDYEVNAASGQVHVWFKDYYEFHPVGYGYSSFPGDTKRETNCVHAAAVELTATSAKNYWMVGDAVVPQSLFAGKHTLSWGKSERDS